MTTSIEERIARLEGSFEQINQRLGTLEQDMRAGFELLGRQLDALASRVDALDARINGRIDQLMYWQLGLLASIAASILAVVITRLL